MAAGTLYRFFRDKKTVFMAVCLRVEEDLGSRMFDSGRRMRGEGRSEQEIVCALTSQAVRAHHEHRAFHREVLAMTISDPDVAAWTRGRETRGIAELLAFLKPERSCYRVQDPEAAAELVYLAAEEVSHRAVLFDSPVGEERLVQGLQDMAYLFLRPALRHRSEQYRTSSQLRRHFLRQVKGLPHTGQTLDGSWLFLGNLGISALGP